MHIREQTSDLNLFGCHDEHRGGPADTGNGHAEDIDAGANLWLFGKVAYALDFLRMGIAFGDRRSHCRRPGTGVSLVALSVRPEDAS